MDLWGLLTADVAIETYKTGFDGILGASVGAWVAVVVLRRTLREQRKGLSEQLEKQESLHREQLRVQQAENARLRLHDVVAELLTNLFGVAEAMHAGPAHTNRKAEFLSVQRDITVNLEKLHLDLEEGDESDLYHVLHGILQFVYEWIELAHIEDEAPDRIDLDVMTEVVGNTGSALVEWVRGDSADRKAELDLLAHTLRMLSSGDFDGWAEQSRLRSYDSSRVLRERLAIG
ncbi:hypothetical protein [Arthrobacter humicola]